MRKTFSKIKEKHSLIREIIIQPSPTKMLSTHLKKMLTSFFFSPIQV